MRREAARVWAPFAAAAAAGLILNRKLLDAETKPAEADGGQVLRLAEVAVHVVLEGSEDHPPVVLLHGFAGSLRWFDGLARRLTPDYRVIRVDLLGHGGSEKPLHGYAIADQARLVEDALRQLRVESALIVGHSMGGAVAVALAERAAEMVRGLVVLDEGPDNTFGSQPLLARLGFVPMLGELMHRLAIDSMVRDGYRDAFAAGYDMALGFEDPDQVVRDFRRMTYTSYKRCWDEEGAYLRAKRLDSRLRDLRVPAVVAFGTEDKFFRAPDSAEAFREIPGVRVELIEGVGHSPNVEQPDAVLRLITEAARS